VFKIPITLQTGRKHTCHPERSEVEVEPFCERLSSQTKSRAKPRELSSMYLLLAAPVRFTAEC
jgi:hypothetical protein